MGKRRALLIVDVQPTFCEGGELPVQGGNLCAVRIANHVKKHARDYALIVTSQDWHIDPGSHFSEHPDFVDTWPVHGVADTPNTQLHESISGLPIDVSVKKGMYASAYSAFEGVDEAGNSLESILRDYDISELDVCGLALSHCVKESALDAQRLGFQTVVYTDLSEPVTRELGQAALEQLSNNQVVCCRSCTHHAETQAPA